MRKTLFTVAALLLHFLVITPGILRAQEKKRVIAVQAECLNDFIYRYDDLETIVEDLNLRFEDLSIVFVYANGNQHADYLLKIRYKKDPPGGYSHFHFASVPNTRDEQALVGPIGYPQQETTPEERLGSTARRSPGTELIPYSVPLLTRPGNNMPPPRQAVPVSIRPGLSKLSTYAYFYLQFTLTDTRDQRIVWSEKKKTNRYVDIYASMIDALAAQVSSL